MDDRGGGEVPPSGPLQGLRVVELGSTVAGPFCARLLADFGADVIKVEQPEGDIIRSMGAHKDGRSLYASSILRSRRIVTLDLRAEEGRDLARRLIGKADIVVENFRPGTLERWDLGFERLRADNPGLVLVRISGFGQSGPYSDRPGYGVTSEAMSGLRGITGYPDAPPPRVGTSLSDYIAGLYAAFGTLAAILERRRTGRGQIVDAALCEAAFSFMEPHIPAFQQLGRVAQRSGAHLPGTAPNALYPTADDSHIHIAAPSDPIFARLAALMGRADALDDPRFATARARAAHVEATDALVAAWSVQHELRAVARLLEEAKVPAAPIYTVEDIFADPHFQAREMLVEAEDDILGPVALPGIVPKLSETPGAVRWAGRQNGADSREVLAQDLGLADADIEDLARRGIVGGIGLASAGTGTG